MIQTNFENETKYSARSDVKKLAGQKNRVGVMTIYSLIMGLFYLTKPPKEKDLRSDLYVMF